ncbi:hypothetical protein ZWY2020_028599 [Hordeum vulgare]|nr:hypothetical protein ZWY2020_028599 [Hordeum vulgare]
MHRPSGRSVAAPALLWCCRRGGDDGGEQRHIGGHQQMCSAQRYISGQQRIAYNGSSCTATTDKKQCLTCKFICIWELYLVYSASGFKS